MRRRRRWRSTTLCTRLSRRTLEGVGTYGGRGYVGQSPGSIPWPGKACLDRVHPSMPWRPACTALLARLSYNTCAPPSTRRSCCRRSENRLVLTAHPKRVRQDRSPPPRALGAMDTSHPIDSFGFESLFSSPRCPKPCRLVLVRRIRREHPVRWTRRIYVAERRPLISPCDSSFLNSTNTSMVAVLWINTTCSFHRLQAVCKHMHPGCTMKSVSVDADRCGFCCASTRRM